MSKRHNLFEALEGRRLLTGTQFPLTFGTLGGDSSSSVATDRAGNIYVAGALGGVGGLARYAPDGTLVYLRNFGSANPNKVAVDAAGNVYIAGTFRRTVDFDPRGGVHNVTSIDGSADAFVAKLSGKGNLVFVKTFGGKGDDVASGLAVTTDGQIRVGGIFQGRANFNPDGRFVISSSGGNDGFITALDSAGVFQWAGSFGGSGNETLADVALDDLGNVLATGSYQGTVDFDPTQGVNNNIATANEAYTLKWTPVGGFVFSAGFGGLGLDFGTAVTADRAGNVYTIGNFESSGDFDPSNSTFTLTGAATGTVFISKLNAAGTFVFAKAIGGAGSVDVGPADISVDKHENVYTTGRFTGTEDFDPNGGTANRVSEGADDVFVSKLDSAGAFVFATTIGGAGDAFPTASVLDRDGNILVTGVFDGAISFPMSGGGSTAKVSGGGTDVFVTKLDSNGVMD
ncbi:MAG: uncharacterized protein JWN40_647 [Phycisphaerales bacterium]|nr:uncharacterized protein [Phycisphaerales bacterium]